MTGQWRYVTSKDMQEIEQLTDTPEEREAKLAAFDADVRRAQGIHKRPPRPEEMGVTEGTDPYALKRQRWHE